MTVGPWAYLGPFILLTLPLASAAPAVAQKLDCSNPITQADFNDCAYQDWQAADADLNDAYAEAVAAAQGMTVTGGTDIEEALRTAQRAWITFRDLACEVESMVAEGGSMQPMLYSGCMTSLTEERTDALRYFAGTDQ